MSATAIMYKLGRGASHTLDVWKIALDSHTELDRLYGGYRLLTKGQEELRSDVSSAIGLFEKQSEISPLDSTRLERCVADLLMLLVQRELPGKGNVILIQGPAFPKVLGRIGYRYPRSDLTIAFVTTDPRFLKEPPAELHGSRSGWEGPFPSYEEDRITRTYFSRSAGVRVDLFAQGLSRYPIHHVVDGYPVGAGAKLDASSDKFLAFGQYLTESRSIGQRSLALEDTTEVMRQIARDDVPKPSTKNLPSNDKGDKRLLASNDGKTLPSGLEEAIFRGVSSIARDSSTWQRRYTALKQFLEKGHLGNFVDNFAFIEYVERRAKEEKPRNAYTVHDLGQWYEEFGSRY